jgi:hypothetical protein
MTRLARKWTSASAGGAAPARCRDAGRETKATARDGRRIALAGEFTHVSRSETLALWRMVANRDRPVTVISVIHQQGLPVEVIGLPPFPTIVTVLCDGERTAYATATRRTQEILALAPARLAVEHLAVTSWSEARRQVKRRRCDDVVVAAPPAKLADRIRVRIAGWAVEDVSGTRAHAAP